MSTNRSLIQIRMKPHLFKYIRYYFAGSDFKVTASHDFAEVLFSFVRQSDVPVKPISGDHVLTIYLPERDKLYERFDGRYCDLYVPENLQDRFNKYVEMLFDKEIHDKLELIRQMNLDHRRSGLMKDTILSVLYKYDIKEEELTYDKMVKRMQRYKQRLESPVQKAI